MDLYYSKTVLPAGSNQSSIKEKTKVNSLKRNPSSHQDPHSHVFEDKDGNIIRKIPPDVIKLVEGSPYFTQVRSPYNFSEDLYRVNRIPFISYYYEYPFPLLKQMALFYLDVLEYLHKHGYSLSDGTPFNCTYTGNNKFEFFDIGSIIPYDKSKGWQGYRQFLTDFYFPLVYLSDLPSIYPGALLPFVNNKQWASHIKLSLKQRLRLPNIIFKSFIGSSFRKDLKAKETTEIEISEDKITKIIALLRSAVRHTDYNKPKSQWDDYYSDTILKDNYLGRKEAIFKAYYEKIVQTASGYAIDWGANTGHFSKIMANGGLTVIAIESDHNAIAHLYETCRTKNIIPLHSSVFNPTPATGFNNSRERLLSRIGSIATVHAALGIVHHMQHEKNLSVDDIIAFFHEHSADRSYLIIEYISPDDERYKLIRNPNYPFDESEESFVKTLEERYTILERDKPIPTREIFLAQKHG